LEPELSIYLSTSNLDARGDLPFLDMTIWSLA
jgi:hypothetical protein